MNYKKIANTFKRFQQLPLDALAVVMTELNSSQLQTLTLLMNQGIKAITEDKLQEVNESIKNEYIVWGIPPGKKDEEVLYTKSKSKSEANKICDLLEKKHGCKKCRVQVLDLSTTPDFTNVFNEFVVRRHFGNIGGIAEADPTGNDTEDDADEEARREDGADRRHLPGRVERPADSAGRQGDRRSRPRRNAQRDHPLGARGLPGPVGDGDVPARFRATEGDVNHEEERSQGRRVLRRQGR